MLRSHKNHKIALWFTQKAWPVFFYKKLNKPHIHTSTQTSHDPYPIKPQLLSPPPMRGGERSAIRIMPPEKA